MKTFTQSQLQAIADALGGTTALGPKATYARVNNVDARSPLGHLVHRWNCPCTSPLPFWTPGSAATP